MKKATHSGGFFEMLSGFRLSPLAKSAEHALPSPRERAPLCGVLSNPAPRRCRRRVGSAACSPAIERKKPPIRVARSMCCVSDLDAKPCVADLDARGFCRGYTNPLAMMRVALNRYLPGRNAMLVIEIYVFEFSVIR